MDLNVGVKNYVVKCRKNKPKGINIKMKYIGLLSLTLKIIYVKERFTSIRNLCITKWFLRFDGLIQSLKS